MRYSLRKLVGCALVFGVVALAAPHAFADDISNNLDVTADAAAETMSLTAGGATGSTTLRVIAQNGDGKNGCNLTSSTTLVVAVNSSNAAVATASPSSITFTACADTPVVTVTPLTAGSTTVSLSLTSNTTAGTFNLAPATFTAQVAPADSTPPTWSCTPAAADSAWHDGNQQSSCTASDPSGLQAGSPASFTLATTVAAGSESANASTNSQSLCDALGNCTTAGPITGWKVDRKAPVVQCTPAAADAVWHTTDQTSSCSATDGGSGVSGSASVTLSTNVPAGAVNANASTDSQNFCDTVGNCAVAGPITGWKIDRQAPLATCVPPAADSVWHGTDQSSACTAGDTNGLAAGSPASFTLQTTVSGGTEDPNASTNSQNLCDTLGNCTTVGPISGWMIDKKVPDYVCASSDGEWHNDNIVINCTATDTSGLRADSPASFTLSTNVAAGTETANASTGTQQLCDIFDNCTTVPAVTGLKVDRKGPSFTCTPADSAWHSTNQSSSCTASDAGSGITDNAATLTTNVGPGDESANASTDSHQFCDNAGNCVTAGPVSGWKIDRKAPAVVCAPADGVWHAANQSSACNATDGGSGVSGTSSTSLSTSVADGEENANASTSSDSFCDNVGNCAPAGPVSGWKIDRKAPSTGCVPSTADAVWHNDNQSSTCSATDGGSGVAGSDTTVLSTTVAAGEENANASTGSHSFCDNVGNCAGVGPITGWKIDRKAPSTGCVPPAADAAWHYDNQSSTCSATDGGSGVAGSDTTVLSTTVIAGDENSSASTGSDSFCDNVGNCAGVGPITGWKIDRKAPVVQCVPAAADAVWHVIDQTSLCSATDGGSGVSGSPSLMLSTNVPAGTENANASTNSDQFCDTVGNCAPAGPITGWKIDRQAPLATCVPPAADSVWHGTDQSSACTAGDTNGLAVDSPASFTLETSVSDGTEDPNASTNFQNLCDTLGNCTTVGPISGWMIDKKVPDYVCGSPDALWHNIDVVISCTATDTSGLRADSPASFTLSTNVAAGTETANASTGTQQLCDIFSNCTTVPAVTGLKVDKKAPSFSCASADSVWHSANQSSSCSASDQGSGVISPASATLWTDVAPGDENVNASTDTHQFCDNVGNCALTGPVSGWKIDRKAPAAQCTPAVADGLWHAWNQESDCTATDGGSGVAGSSSVTLSTSVAAGTEDPNASTGSHQFCDAVANCVTRGPISGWKIDMKAPINVTFAGSITDGANYYFGFVPANNMTCTATDGGSGLGSCAVTGYSQAVGPHTLTATANDNVGNVGTSTLTYNVLAWTVNGFYQPVDMVVGTWNTVKGGSTVPLKFNVYAGTTELTSTSVVTSFTATKLSCPNGAPEDEIEFVTTGGTGLRYDTTGGQFIQNWQTPKQPGFCYKVTVMLQDGQSKTASFKLK